MKLILSIVVALMGICVPAYMFLETGFDIDSFGNFMFILIWVLICAFISTMLMKWDDYTNK